LVGEERLRLPTDATQVGEALDRERTRERFNPCLSDPLHLLGVAHEVDRGELDRPILDQAQVLPIGEGEEETGRLGRLRPRLAEDEPAGSHQVDNSVEVGLESERQELRSARDLADRATDEGLEGWGDRLQDPWPEGARGGDLSPGDPRRQGLDQHLQIRQLWHPASLRGL